MTRAEGDNVFPGLGITQKEIDRVRVHSDPYSNNREILFQYIQEINVRFRCEQPLLYDYIRTNMVGIKIHDPLTFGLAVTLTYDMIPEAYKLQPLSEGELEATRQSIYEYRESKKSHPIDLIWYFEKLGSDPEFSSWLTGMVRGLDKQKLKSDFIFGVILVSLPFYMRSEARALENELFKSASSKSCQN